MITASLSNHRISPRKVRVTAGLVCGKSAEEALVILSATPKKAADPLAGLIRSAMANAKNNFQMDQSSLVIKELRVDGGQVLKRSRPRSRGMANRIKKRTSNILVVLAPAPEPKKVEKKARKAEAPTGK